MTLTETLSTTEEQTPLPKGWRLVRLGDVCTRISNGTSKTQNLEKKGLPVSRIETISFCNINVERIGYIDRPQEELKRYFLNEGDILFSHINSLEKIGNCALYEGTPFVLIHGMNLLRIEPNRNLVDSSFLLSFLRTESARRFYFDNARRAIGQASININDISKLNVLIPPTVEEQRRIATVLDEQMKAVEQTRVAVEAQLAAANLLPNAFLRAVFESDDARNWQKRKLSEVCESYTGTKDPSKTLQTSFEYVDISSVDNVNKRITGSRKILSKDAPSRARQIIFANDVIVATTRPNLNAVALIPEKLNDEICSTGFCVLRSTNQIDSNFLFAYVQSSGFVDSLSDLVKGALYPAVTDKQVKQQTISLPSIEQQKAIAAKLDEQMQAVETLKKSLTAKLEAVKQLPAALLRKAFAGEI